VEDPQQAKIQGRKLQQMIDYASTKLCRRVQVLRYFGETYRGANCGACDVCVPGARKVDLTREAQIVMSAVARTGERHGAGHLIDIVMGNLTDTVSQLGHHMIKTFGAGKDKDAATWRQVIADLLARACVVASGSAGSSTGAPPVGVAVTAATTRQAGVSPASPAGAGDEPALMLMPKGKDVLFGRRRFILIRSSKPALSKAAPPKPRASAKSQAGRREPIPTELDDRLMQEAARRDWERRASEEGGGEPAPAAWDEDDYDAELFEELRSLRKQLAKEKSMPPFVIFSDHTLREMARDMPCTLAQMRGISGVGKQKLSEFGFGFINLIGQYLDKHPARRPSAARPPAGRPPHARPKPNKPDKRYSGDSNTLDATWRLVRQGMAIPQIAARRNKAQSTIVGHVEELILKGFSVDISPYVNPKEQELLRTLFAKHGFGCLGQVVAAANGQADYPQARLVRAMLKAKK
jgi:ATP-dependent DNA helicase RecQ